MRSIKALPATTAELAICQLWRKVEDENCEIKNLAALVLGLAVGLEAAGAHAEDVNSALDAAEFALYRDAVDRQHRIDALADEYDIDDDTFAEPPTTDWILDAED
jgi:hypothetical protein